MEGARMKLLKELKQENLLTAADLDDIAAGSVCQMSEDSLFLHKLLEGRPARPNSYDLGKCYASKGAVQKELAAAWASVGIEAVLNTPEQPCSFNRYSLNGVPITRDEAWAHARETIGPSSN